jgi:acetyl esterase
MPLDAHVKRFLTMVAAGGARPASDLTVPKMRQAILRLAQAVDAKGVPIGMVEDRDLPGPGGPLPIRIYGPAAGNGDTGAGLIYFHGGAGVFCDIETHDGLCRMLTNESGCRLISVGYRLAPEHPFPAAVEDSVFVTRWVFEHASALGIDPTRIAVAGDSAGGTLAAVVCQLAKQTGGPTPALQILFCPVTDVSVDSAWRKACPEGSLLNGPPIEWALRHYCPRDADLADPRLSPLRAGDFSGLPPAHIHTAEFDPLRDQGEAYADQLERAGVKVQYTCHDGMIHHFYGMAGTIPYARVAIKAAGAAIKEALV